MSVAQVNEALTEALKKGTSFGAPSLNENVLAQVCVQACAPSPASRGPLLLAPAWWFTCTKLVNPADRIERMANRYNACCC